MSGTPKGALPNWQGYWTTVRPNWFASMPSMPLREPVRIICLGSDASFSLMVFDHKNSFLTRGKGGYPEIGLSDLSRAKFIES